MRTENVNYFDGEQKLIGRLFWQTEAQKPLPTVIIFSAFEGLSAFTCNYAERLAKKGFAVFAADVYGDAKTANTIDGCFELITPFLADRALVRQRAALAYQAILKHPMVNKDNIAALGFCFGGMCALELARSGAELQAVVSMHGVLAKSNLVTFPIKSKILILHGYNDPQVPPEQLTPFADEMASAGVDDWTFTFFSNTLHSYTDPLTGTFDPEKEAAMGRKYNPVAAERSFRYAVDFLAECLLR